MRRLTAAALATAAVAALVYRPSREWLGDAMIDAGIRLAYGEPPPAEPRARLAHSPTELDERAVDAIMAEIRRREHRNGTTPI